MPAPQLVAAASEPDREQIVKCWGILLESQEPGFDCLICAIFARQSTAASLARLPPMISTSYMVIDSGNPSWRPLMRSHVERRCSILGPTQSRISPSMLQYTRISAATAVENSQPVFHPSHFASRNVPQSYLFFPSIRRIFGDMRLWVGDPATSLSFVPPKVISFRPRIWRHVLHHTETVWTKYGP